VFSIVDEMIDERLGVLQVFARQTKWQLQKSAENDPMEWVLISGSDGGGGGA
jgi:hypothetical protein